jgi:hypothetical protein
MLPPTTGMWSLVKREQSMIFPLKFMKKRKAHGFAIANEEELF